MKIAVIVVPKAARAAVVQIAPPKLDHRVGLVAMAAENVAVVKLAVLVAVDQMPDQNPEAPVVKDARKVDQTLAPNDVDQAKVALKQLPNHAALVVKDAPKVDQMLAQNVVDQVEDVRKQPPNHAALVAKARQKLDAMPVQNVDAANVARKRDKMAPDDVAPMQDRIVPSLRAVLNLELDQVALNAQTLDAHRHIEVASAAVR